MPKELGSKTMINNSSSSFRIIHFLKKLQKYTYGLIRILQLPEHQMRLPLPIFPCMGKSPNRYRAFHGKRKQHQQIEERRGKGRYICVPDSTATRRQLVAAAVKAVATCTPPRGGSSGLVQQGRRQSRAALCASNVSIARQDFGSLAVSPGLSSPVADVNLSSRRSIWNEKIGRAHV